jgi:hypothetical protein
MTVHHLMGDLEVVRTCPNCKRQIPARWCSKFDVSNAHYKDFDCECGYTVSIRVDFSGTGDDSWNENLDKRIEEVESESQRR